MSQEILNKKIKLSNGYKMPVIGLGTYRTETDEKALRNAIKVAIENNYRLIDTAWIYGCEAFIGNTLEEIFKERQDLKREDLFITSKVWNAHHSKNRVRECFEDSLKKLKLHYLDLYLIHWPVGFKEVENDPIPKDEKGKILYSDVNYIETYHAMEELVKEGKIRSIGVCNFNIKQISDILNECEIKPVVNQVEIHPYLQNEKLVKFCQNNGITVQAYAPLGAGEKTICSKPGVPFLLENEVLLNIGKKHKKTPAQVCLRFLLQRNITCLPKSVTPKRIIENIQVFDFELSEDDMQAIRGINQNLRIYSIEDQRDHPLFPFGED